jgi:hypothetical protein
MLGGKKARRLESYRARKPYGGKINYSAPLSFPASQSYELTSYDYNV